MSLPVYKIDLFTIVTKFYSKHQLIVVLIFLSLGLIMNKIYDTKQKYR